MIVNFNAFNDSSVDFFVYTFTKTTGWVAFHEIKQAILLEIAAIIEQHGAEIAYPTQTLHMADVLGKIGSTLGSYLMTQMLFYENPKPLSPALHTGLSIKQDRARFKFAKRVNSVLCAGVEFAEMAFEYPIVFVEGSDGWVPIVYLG